MATPLLSIQNVSYAYHTFQGETSVLKNLSMELYPGEFVAVVGPSGCGKSTLLSLITGLIKPEEGEIKFATKTGMETTKLGYMLQKDHLFEWRSVFDNALLGLEITGKLTEENIDYVAEAFKEYGLWDFKDQKPSELSGGMRQRVALIRTLALSPELLLLDEPFSALDYQTRLSVSADIGRIIRNSKKTVLLITHDLSEAISLSDKVLVFSQRPANIKNEIPISLSIEGNHPLAARNAPEFNHYFNLLWEELSNE
ncbi:MAG: ABC transporter ATP-binding protein [Lachnospiraceae bacterium]|nr:ABC transporter ATP-binding protein [Lachnospiraceae bacterium]MBQ9123813.1 ABC transporter ATP-binding protein [Lachnospiraceae bacterium]